MISIHLSDFTTDCIVFALCWWLFFNGIDVALKAWSFWLERKLIREQKRASRPDATEVHHG